ncbi:hypothetical protein BGW38_004114, partial [Lunasporangiospora selenospora]
MGRSSSDAWFAIRLDQPFVTIPSQSSSLSEPESEKHSVRGVVILRLSKQTKIKSLSVNLTGLARTEYSFDSSRIHGAKPPVYRS